MPYISQESRIPYVPLIEKTIKLICEDTDFRRAENLGYFIQRLFFVFSQNTYNDDYMDFLFLDNDFKSGTALPLFVRLLMAKPIFL